MVMTVHTEVATLPRLDHSGRTHLYLCVFPAELKIGVTLKDVYGRVKCHVREARAPLECVHVMEMLDGGAFWLELQIARRFGAVRDPSRGRHSEWFPRDHEAEVLAMMRGQLAVAA